VNSTLETQPHTHTEKVSELGRFNMSEDFNRLDLKTLGSFLKIQKKDASAKLEIISESFLRTARRAQRGELLRITIFL